MNARSSEAKDQFRSQARELRTERPFRESTGSRTPTLSPLEMACGECRGEQQPFCRAGSKPFCKCWVLPSLVGSNNYRVCSTCHECTGLLPPATSMFNLPQLYPAQLLGNPSGLAFFPVPLEAELARLWMRAQRLLPCIECRTFCVIGPSNNGL